MKNPSKIPGLKIWIDAADTTTINNGTVQNSQNVFKIVDKSSGYVFRNGYGVNGPSYSVGVVNGKNAITFNYYTLAQVNSILAKGLWAGNVTPMTTGTYSLYYVAFPYDNRQRNANGVGVTSQQDLWLFTLVNSLPTNLTNYQPHRGAYFRTPGPNAGGTGLTNSAPRFVEDNDFVFGPTTSLFDLSNVVPGIHSIPQSDSKYIYGKTNLIGVRAFNNLKKFSTIRRDYISRENFQPKSLSDSFITPLKDFTPALNGPWLTIGGFLPNHSDRSVEGVAGPVGGVESTNFPLNGNAPATNDVYPFEGYFCEFLFYDRVLSDSESNSVEDYLKEKWIG